MRKLKDLSKEEINEILCKRHKNLFEKDIIKYYNISQRQYYNLLKDNGIIRKYKVKKYKFNEDYFEVIDTEDKAYFLGFIVADGCISSSSNVIQITQKESHILYEFLYKDASIYLKRKKETFDKVMSINKIKTKYRKSCL